MFATLLKTKGVMSSEQVAMQNTQVIVVLRRRLGAFQVQTDALLHLEVTSLQS